MKYYLITLLTLALCLSACAAEPEPVPEPETAPVMAPEPVPARAPAEIPEPEGAEELFGYLSEKGYENPWFGFEAELEAACYIGTVEEGAAIPAQGESVRVLSASGERGEWDITVTVSGAGAGATAEDYAAAMKTLAPAAYAKAELELTGSALETLSFAGAEYPALRVAAERRSERGDTLAVYQLTVFIKHGRYIAAVTATTYIEDFTDSLIGGFYALA